MGVQVGKKKGGGDDREIQLMRVNEFWMYLHLFTLCVKYCTTGVAGVDVHLWLLSVWEMAMEKNEIAKQREYVCSLVLNPNKMKFWKKKSPKEILNLISDDEKCQKC